MSNYGWVEEIATNELSNRGLVLVSRFARLVKQVSGDVINLQDPALTKNVVHFGANSSDARVQGLFEELLIEFQTVSESKGKPNRRESSPNKQLEVELSDDKVRFYRGVAIQSTRRVNK